MWCVKQKLHLNNPRNTSEVLWGNTLPQKEWDDLTKTNLLADLKSIPVNVPAATVLMSSSAPLAFSIATPKALYNNATNKEIEKTSSQNSSGT